MSPDSPPPSPARADPEPARLLRLEIDVPESAAEAAAAVAWAIGAQGVAIRDGSTGDAPAGRAVICVWLPEEDGDAVRHRAAEQLGPLRDAAALRLVPEQADGWRAALARPVSVGGFTLMPLTGPADREADDRRPSGRTLWIEPGSAFGGGTHPTTRLCAEAIEAAFTPAGEAAEPGANGAPDAGEADARPTPRRVLDVGTGTGILALIAAALGAEVAATDIDPLARHAARRHAEANGLADRITVSAEPPPGLFDLVVANLYLGPLTALAPSLAARLGPRGRCVVSGITLRHQPTIERAFAAADLRVVACAELDGWIALTLGRPRPDRQTDTPAPERP